MSALLGYSPQGDRVDILTDAAGTRKGGTVHAIHAKQLLLKSGIVIAGVGLWNPTVIFARIVDAFAKTFDDLGGHPPEIWRKIRAKLHPDDSRKLCSIALAGWSEKNQRAEMHVVNDNDDGGVEFLPNEPGFRHRPWENTCVEGHPESLYNGCRYRRYPPGDLQRPR
jgi:hypothetical protein